MSKKKPENQIPLAEGTAALDSLAPGSKPAAGLPDSFDISKSELLRQIVAVSGQVEKGDLSKFLQSLQQIGHEADKLPSGASKDSNEATIKGKKGLGVSGSMKEDVAALFGGTEGISEEFIDSATGIFESALEARLVVETTRLEEEFEAKVDSAISEMTDDLVEKVSDHLDYVVEMWFEQNKVAIDNSIRADVMESFIDGMKNLFKEHYIEVPEEKVDVVAELSSQVEELQARLNDAISENVSARSIARDASRAAIIAQVSEGMVLSQAEKLKDLAESVDFSDEDSFRQKIEMVKESYFSPQSKGRTTTQLVTEEIVHDAATGNAVGSHQDTQPVRNDSMSRYTAALTRTVKKH
jgi:hypothetical protein